MAQQILIDRSTGRMTTGQRVSLNSVEAAAAEQRGGSDPAAASTYFVFEHVSQVGVRVCVWGGGSHGVRGRRRRLASRLVAVSVVAAAG